MNYPKKPGFNLYQLRHCAFITYIVKTWFLKNLSAALAQTLLALAETLVALAQIFSHYLILLSF